MKLDKAIEMLTLILKAPYNFCDQDTLDAIKLGIEALKAWQEHRRIMDHPKLWILPGETED